MFAKFLPIATLFILYIQQPTPQPQSRPSNYTRNLLLSGRPKIFAHRGGTASGRENSLSAIKQAAQVGADGIIIEVGITKDNKLVVLADNNLKRLTGQDTVITSINYENILPYLDTIQNSYGEDYTQDNQDEKEKIPLLEDVLEFVAEETTMIISIKDNIENVAGTNMLLSSLKKHGMLGRTILNTPISSSIVREIFGEQINLVDGAEFVVKYHTDFVEGKWATHPEMMQSDIMQSSFNFETLKESAFYTADFNEELTIQEFVKDLEQKKSSVKVMNMFLKERGIPVVYQPVNTAQDFKTAVELGANAIVTDNVAEMFLHLRKEFLHK